MKMWVRKWHGFWQVGCQCCGRLVFEDWTWKWAVWGMQSHINAHKAGRYDPRD